MNRRTFVLTAGSAAAASRAANANNRIRLGIVGSSGRGKYLMRQVNEVGGVEWVAVADVYNVRRDQAEALPGNKIEQYRDYRRLIERKDTDGVIIAAPDHWHVRMQSERRLRDARHAAGGTRDEAGGPRHPLVPQNRAVRLQQLQARIQF
jgi:FlaA1/EpsC-like NDP-sugar epimerase